MVQYGTVWYSMVQYGTVWYSMVWDCWDAGDLSGAKSTGLTGYLHTSIPNTSYGDNSF